METGIPFHSNVAKFVTGQVTFPQRRQNSYNDRCLNIKLRVVSRNLDALSDLSKYRIYGTFDISIVESFSYKVVLAPVYNERVPSTNFYGNIGYSEAYSGFPQSLPQIKNVSQIITSTSFLIHS